MWSMNPQYLHHSDIELDENAHSWTLISKSESLEVRPGTLHFCQALQEIFMAPNVRTSG